MRMYPNLEDDISEDIFEGPVEDEGRPLLFEDHGLYRDDPDPSEISGSAHTGEPVSSPGEPGCLPERPCGVNAEGRPNFHFIEKLTNDLLPGLDFFITTISLPPDLQMSSLLTAKARLSMLPDYLTNTGSRARVRCFSLNPVPARAFWQPRSPSPLRPPFPSGRLAATPRRSLARTERAALQRPVHRRTFVCSE